MPPTECQSAGHPTSSNTVQLLSAALVELHASRNKQTTQSFSEGYLVSINAVRLCLFLYPSIKQFSPLKFIEST